MASKVLKARGKNKVSNNHVIELNGNKYNALTGQIITDGSLITPQKHHTAGLDGVAKPRRQPVAAKPLDVSKVHQKQTRSQTLMRSAVKKPAANPVHAVTAARRRPAQTTVAKSKAVKNPSAVGAIDPHRVVRAQHTPKSGLISRFGLGRSSSPVTVTEVPVTPAPHNSVSSSSRRTKHTTQNSTNRSRTIFDAALQTATSHEQPKAKKQRLHHRIARKLHIRSRTLLIGVGGLSVLIVGSFLAYTRVPSVAMKVAAAKAGIHATLPAYQPAGFSLRGPIAAAPGEISLNYKSNSDARDYKLVQKSSSWNSETLFDNFVAVAKETSYQTFQSSGRTIYIYDDSNATWVDGGIWYKIEGNSSLNSDQLLRIANSL